jgi:hypothetical protein
VTARSSRCCCSPACGSRRRPRFTSRTARGPGPDDRGELLHGLLDHRSVLSRAPLARATPPRRKHRPRRLAQATRSSWRFLLSSLGSIRTRDRRSVTGRGGRIITSSSTDQETTSGGSRSAYQTRADPSRSRSGCRGGAGGVAGPGGARSRSAATWDPLAHPLGGWLSVDVHVQRTLAADPVAQLLIRAGEQV